MEMRETGEHQLAARRQLPQQEQHRHRVRSAGHGRDHAHVRRPQRMCDCVAPDAVNRCKLCHTVTTTIALLAHLAIAAASGQPAPALRIVVIQGEDAVNIIQQKTAVAPVVEIRDRNNLPVAGATVTFTIGGNTAAFAGGLQTITVATNAAGQAAAVAINPIASGAVQIQVAAAFQGQAAAATIVQTNVLTAAQAATAAGATSAGASSGSTGGFSRRRRRRRWRRRRFGHHHRHRRRGGCRRRARRNAGWRRGFDSPRQRAPAPRIFRGAFSLLVTLPFQGCARQELWSGTLEFALASTDPPAGNATITGATGRTEAVTCSAGPQVGNIQTFGMPGSPVTGTTANLGFTYERSNDFPPGPTPGEVGGVNTMVFSFTGSFNGAEITGTLSHTRRILGTG